MVFQYAVRQVSRPVLQNKFNIPTQPSTSLPQHRGVWSEIWNLSQLLQGRRDMSIVMLRDSCKHCRLAYYLHTKVHTILMMIVYRND